jgi:hypothetical protein
MPSPPNLISPAPPSSPSSPATTAGPPEQHRTWHWLRRADLFFRVMVHLYAGLILFFAPWTHFWTYNRFLVYYASVSKVMESGAIRGLVSGLGLLNLWIAISEAIHYKES